MADNGLRVDRFHAGTAEENDTVKEPDMAIPYLYWRRLDLTNTAIESDSDLWSAIKLKVEEAGLSNINQSPANVTGQSEDTIVAVTFVKCGQHSYALIIMAAGNHAHDLRDQVYGKLKTMHS